jgi:hypothetical protein
VGAALSTNPSKSKQNGEKGGLDHVVTPRESVIAKLAPSNVNFAQSSHNPSYTNPRTEVILQEVDK